MYFPSQEQYSQLSQEYNLIPVYREYLADTETPVSIYRKISSGGSSFLLESVEGGKSLARYSFIGTDCFLSYRFYRGKAECWGLSGKAKLHGGPLQALKGLLSRYRTPQLPGLPRFTGGAVGYFGYDMVRYLERLPDEKADDLNLPICQLVFPGIVLVFDHVSHTLKIVANIPLSGSPAETYRQAVRRIEQMADEIFAPGENGGCPLVDPISNSQQVLGEWLREHASMNEDDFVAAVNRALAYIKSGDIFQVVLSQRFNLPYAGDPFELYRSLRSINPSPYLTYLDFGNLALVAASPEMLVRVEGEEVLAGPIAGTRPRGKNEREDRQLAVSMLADEKERAEHLMLVDLARNDLGRVCEPGSVTVPKFMQVERFSHVMHLVSEVSGRLEEGQDSLAALAACFPAGTLSGAPKIRAMEIIEELEPVHRGPYGGAVGYIDFAGNMDTAITIRTVLLHQGKAYFQAGAGIVADSDPVKEYQETLHKASAMAAAIIKSLKPEGLKHAGCY